MNDNDNLLINDKWQTRIKGILENEYKIYLALMDNGKGGDITNNGLPLKTYEQWIKQYK